MMNLKFFKIRYSLMIFFLIIVFIMLSFVLSKSTFSLITNDEDVVKVELLTDESDLTTNNGRLVLSFKVTINQNGEMINEGNTLTISNTLKNLNPDFASINADEYKTYINNSTTDNKTYTADLSNNSDNNKVDYVNNYEATSLTGVIVRIIPFFLLLLVAGTGVILLTRRAKA